MISIEQAVQMVSARADAAISTDFMPAESVALSDSIGRVLREAIHADVDSPSFNRSIRDGFAVKASDVQTVPVELDVIGESRAGLSFDGVVGAGQCS